MHYLDAVTKSFNHLLQTFTESFSSHTAGPNMRQLHSAFYFMKWKHYIVYFQHMPSI